MYAPPTSWPRHLFVSCTTTTCCKSQEGLPGLVSKVAGEECLYGSSHSNCFCCSKKYVKSILSRLPLGQLHLSMRVRAVSQSEGKVILLTASGGHETFDHIIFACHVDDALRILDAGSGATSEERDILSTFQWNRNDVWVHSDKDVGVHFLSSPQTKWWRTFKLSS